MSGQRASDREGAQRSTDEMARLMAELLAQLQGAHGNTLHVLDAKHRENTEHLLSIENLLITAFPNGDAESHRRFHEAMINKALSQEKFWNDLRSKLIERGIWAVLIFVAGAVLVAFKSHLMK